MFQEFKGYKESQEYVSKIYKRYSEGYLHSDGYYYLGMYPQTVLDDTSIIEELNKLTEVNINGYYEYDGKQYAKLTAKSYELKFSNGKDIVNDETYYFEVELIKWTVLETIDNTLTLLTNMILDQGYYNTSLESITVNDETIYSNNYEYSTIRYLLNNRFYNQAFNDVAKSAISTSFIDNSAKPTIIIPNQYVSNDTHDKIYLLSNHQARNIYYTANSKRRATATDYAKARYVFESNDYSFWWLRSPYDLESGKAFCIGDNGDIYIGPVNTIDIGIRPALKIKIKWPPFKNNLRKAAI